MTAGSPRLILGVPLSPIAEQNNIASALMIIEMKIDTHKRKAETLRELFKAMLHQLMTGQIRVHHLDIDVSEVQAS